MEMPLPGLNSVTYVTYLRDTNMKEHEALAIVDELLAQGEDSQKILALSCEAMQVVGDRYQRGTYFLPELVMSGEILHKIGEVLKPKLAAKQAEPKKLGTVVLGTVRGDIHDIGKDIVGFMLEVNGFEVHDLGIDQPEENFVAAVRDHKPQVLALSGFVSVAFDSMKSTIEQVEAAGLRKGLKVIIGGGQIDDTVRKYTGTDAYGDDAMAAVAFAKEAVGVK
jgi:5-methyltetrahydrofolate--homocysteine methyltransferase